MMEKKADKRKGDTGETKRPGVRQNKRTGSRSCLSERRSSFAISPSKSDSPRYCSLLSRSSNDRFDVPPLTASFLQTNASKHEENSFSLPFFDVKMYRNEKRAVQMPDANCVSRRKDKSSESHVFWLPKLATSSPLSPLLSHVPASAQQQHE